MRIQESIFLCTWLFYKARPDLQKMRSYKSAVLEDGMHFAKYRSVICEIKHSWPDILLFWGHITLFKQTQVMQCMESSIRKKRGQESTVV